MRFSPISSFSSNTTTVRILNYLFFNEHEEQEQRGSRFLEEVGIGVLKSIINGFR